MAASVPVARASTARTVAVVCFVTLWLGTQIGLPLWQRSLPFQARFGWQMFSGWRTESTPARGVTFVGIGADGQRTTLSARKYLVRHRPEIRAPYAERVTAHICRVEPLLRSVEAVRSGRVLFRQPCRAGPQ